MCCHHLNSAEDIKHAVTEPPCNWKHTFQNCFQHHYALWQGWIRADRNCLEGGFHNMWVFLPNITPNSNPEIFWLVVLCVCWKELFFVDISFHNCLKKRLSRLCVCIIKYWWWMMSKILKVSSCTFVNNIQLRIITFVRSQSHIYLP